MAENLNLKEKTINVNENIQVLFAGMFVCL